MLDEIDLKILRMLQKDARVSNSAMARCAGMATSAIFERIKKLKALGVIRGYRIDLEPRMLGMGLLAYVFVKVNIRRGQPDAALLLAEIPEVQEVHHIAGEDCLMVKIRAPDTGTLGDLLTEHIHCLEGVQSTRTTIVLKTVKDTAELPLTYVGEMGKK
ncbi:MAG: Lrp/AsnC family transcriptional regulator [Deltaproteobacteria bacterium]|nr:Lrp/AsnC family transcriptional regulator [Deltaproteobacteria bacterium]